MSRPQPMKTGMLLLTTCVLACATAPSATTPAAAVHAAQLASPAAAAFVQPHGGMLRYPAVSATQIVFVYADDLWLVPRAGGVATPLASPAGVELLPRFSPDGRTIAFVGNYDGSKDLYTIPAVGGIPTRVTHGPGVETLSAWTSADKLLFFSNGLAGRDRQTLLYQVSPQGGMPEKLPVPYGAFADISSDGKWLAYTPHTADFRTWKRYRGGMQTDIWLFDLQSHAAKQATDWEGTDTAPMWNGAQLYYLSDDGPSHRLNLWTLDPSTLKKKQLTTYADHDVKWPSIGPGASGGGEIIFQHGAELALFDIASGKTSVVHITIPGAQPKLRPREVDVSKFLSNWDISPTGKRLAVGGRGDAWSLPAKEGSPRNLTRTSGVAERDPSFSPDGKSIAWLSDATGEYEIYLAPADGVGEAKQLTHDGHAFRRLLGWSPDSKWIVFSDKTGTLFVESAQGGEPRTISKDPWAGDLISFPPSWSQDSHFLAFSETAADTTNAHLVIWEVENGTRHDVTSGMFDDAQPAFDRKGDYLYFRRRGNFSPLYGEIEQSFIYANTGQLVLVPLRTDVKSPFAPKSDEEEEKKAEDKKDEKKDDATAKQDGDEEKSDDQKDEAKKDDKPAWKIDFDGFERRAVLLPTEPGVFGQLAVNDSGSLLFLRGSPQGDDSPTTLKIIDVSADKPEEKQIAQANAFALSADGKKLLALAPGGPQIGDAKADTKLEAVPLSGMLAQIDPRAEWRELFDDAWRMYRDFFYDPNMHHVDWKKVHDQYAAMLADCASREDLSYVIREMISELNVGHAYYNGGDVDSEPHANLGLLGCDYVLDSGAWKIAKILEGAAWDTDARGPLSQPGVDVKAGDYLLAVNGVPLDPKLDPWTSFQNLAGKTVTLTVSAKPVRDESARSVVVETLGSEHDLRYRDWIEGHRKYVEDKTGGKVGYVYVPSTGLDGQNDLVRQWQGQLQKQALIVDERWNSGGQIPTRFIELLNRPLTNAWARRDGKDWPWPPDAHQGPKCMLINGLSGSGGDAFPYYFRQAGLGKLIGMRTWGGLIGLSGYPSLIDGGDVEVPSFAFYEKDGTWGIEGNGVEPDILVVDDPSKMVDGGDPQLDAAIAEMLSEIKSHPFTPPKRPAYPDRSGMGLDPKDK
ncbi:MAG: PDZ domain-containing protein [Planctomycetes bacterium]|nr:PDZ domain-containing protein [Planctomycetota bacterium]